MPEQLTYIYSNTNYSMHAANSCITSGGLGVSESRARLKMRVLWWWMSSYSVNHDKTFRSSLGGANHIIWYKFLLLVDGAFSKIIGRNFNLQFFKVLKLVWNFFIFAHYSSCWGPLWK